MLKILRNNFEWSGEEEGELYLTDLLQLRQVGFASESVNIFATGCSVLSRENRGSTNSLRGAESGMVPLTYKVFN